MTGGSRVGLIAQAVALVLLLFLPTLASLSGYQLHILELILLTIPLGIGLLISMGHCGQINLAQVALYGVGAYTTAILIIASTCRPMARDVRGCAGRRCRRDDRRPAVSSDPGSLPCDRDVGIGRCGRNGLHCRRRTDWRAARDRAHPDPARDRHVGGPGCRLLPVAGRLLCRRVGHLPGCSLRVRSAPPSGRSATITLRPRAWE